MADPVSPAELIHGTVRKPAPPFSPAHQPLVARIHGALDDYVTPRGLGRLFTAIEIVLDRREGLVLLPDITFIVEGRESIVNERVWGPPDMVLEVTSPATSSSKLLERVAWYSGYGVRECWADATRAARVGRPEPGARWRAQPHTLRPPGAYPISADVRF
ncbi:MAG: Uma2 family endonuclease [Acidobacteria bacterium]|nr:Uma2 family endonuclease [Acidobacteriota bacterium]